MTMTTVRDWTRGTKAYLPVEIGRGSMEPVSYIRPDCWVVTGSEWAQRSYCCCWDTVLYVPADEAELASAVADLQAMLATRRASASAAIRS